MLRFLTLRVDASKSRFPISQGIYNDVSTKKILKTGIHWTWEINRCIPEQILCRRFLLLIFFCCNGGGRGGGTDEALAMINTHVHTLSCLQAWFCDYDVLKPPSPLGMMLCPFVELFCCLFFFSLRHHSGIIFAQSCSIYAFASYLKLVSYQFLQFPLPSRNCFWATHPDFRPIPQTPADLHETKRLLNRLTSVLASMALLTYTTIGDNVSDSKGNCGLCKWHPIAIPLLPGLVGD